MITGMIARRVAQAEIIGIDPLQTPASLTLSESNRRYKKIGGISGSWQRAHCTNPQSSGKRLFEIEITDTGYQCIGVMSSSVSGTENTDSPEDGDGGLGCAMWTTARLYYGGGAYYNASMLTNAIGDVLRFYYDFSTGKVWVSRNGALLSGDPATGTGATYTIGLLGEMDAAVGTYEDNAGARVALTADQLSSDPIPSGWEPWA